jgi:hypothetical protein
VVAWQLGMGADDFGDLLDFATTQPTIVFTPPRERVRWSRVAGITVVLCAVTGARHAARARRRRGLGRRVLEPAHQLVRRRVGLRARGTASRARDFPRGPSRSPRRRRPPAETKELEVRLSTAADHAAVGKDALARGAWEEAATAYRKALQLDPKNHSYKLGLGIAAEHLLESAKGRALAADRRSPHHVERQNKHFFGLGILFLQPGAKSLPISGAATHPLVTEPLIAAPP